MRHKNEIKQVEIWENIWWDLNREAPFKGELPSPIPSTLEQRYVWMEKYKPVHFPDDGELETISEVTRQYKVLVRCLTCGKTFWADF